MFQTPEDSKYTSVSELGGSELVVLDADELVPEDGKDEVYDNIMQEINELEEELKAELKKIRKQTGCVSFCDSFFNQTESYFVDWTLHTGIARKGRRFVEFVNVGGTLHQLCPQEIYLVQLQGKDKDKKLKDWTLSGSTKACMASNYGGNLY